MISGLLPVLTILAYTNDSLPTIYALGIGSLIAALFFAGMLTYQSAWSQNLSQQNWFDLIVATFCIGIFFHGVYFLSLEFTSANNVSIIMQLQILFTFLIIGFLRKKEPVSSQHFGGAFLMMLGAIYLLYDGHFLFNIGDLLIIIGCIVAPIGNVFAKRALHSMSIGYMMFWRSLISGIVLCLGGYIRMGGISSLVLIDSMWYLLFTGIVYLAITKIVRMYTIKKISVTHAVSFTALTPVFVFLFSWLLLDDVVSSRQLISALIITAGLFILMQAKLKKTQYGVED